MILRFHPATVSAMLKPQEDSLRLLDRRNVAKLRILATNLALRAYRLDHPDAPLPPNVDAVVPAYLAEVPADPFGKGPLRMKVGGGAAVVYSVGPDGIDDGGPAMAIPLRGPFTKTTRGDITLGPWESSQELKAGGRPSGRP